MSAAEKRLSVELLPKLLRYEPETGKLYWRERGAEWFSGGPHGAEAYCLGWNKRHSGQEAGTVKAAPYSKISLLGECLFSHRVIWALLSGSWPEGEIDHINGDPSDNRAVNLRCVSKTENMRNQSRRRTNRSGFTGVISSRNSGRWVASIKSETREIYLGSYDTKEEAYAARKAAEICLGFHPNHGRAA